jgi:hypothetical protein
MNEAQRVGGARELASAATWSPTRIVLAIEAEGMKKFFAMNVKAKSPTTSVVQIDAKD